MIGKDLDLEILDSSYGRYPGGVFYLTSLLLNESCEMGQRFHAIYHSVGDMLSLEPAESSLFLCTTNILPVWDNRDNRGNMCNSDDIYTISGDRQHMNVEVFHRLQTSGNCFLQAPILIHWYKSLWGQEGEDASAISFIHLSKYVRNAWRCTRCC
jgi:hypothetical protein